jgi:hypothetical protein
LSKDIRYVHMPSLSSTDNCAFSMKNYIESSSHDISELRKHFLF